MVKLRAMKNFLNDDLLEEKMNLMRKGHKKSLSKNEKAL